MVNKEVADALAGEARREGKPLFYLSNEIIKLYLKARNEGLDLKEVLKAYESIMLAKRIAFSLVPNEVMDLLLEDLPPEREAAITRAYAESGQKLAQLQVGMRMKDIVSSIRLIFHIFWDVYVNVDMQDEEDLVSLCVACPNYSLVKTRLVSSFIEGYMRKLDYYLLSSELSKGLFSAQFRRSRGSGERSRILGRERQLSSGV